LRRIIAVLLLVRDRILRPNPTIGNNESQPARIRYRRPVRIRYRWP